MRETLQYTEVEGRVTTKDVTVYALSTCGFCRRGLEFLQQNSVAFRYVYIDLLPLEEKRVLKEELREHSGKKVAFPFLSINDEEYFVGFVEEGWKKILGL